jgi:hypothetical protein
MILAGDDHEPVAADLLAMHPLKERQRHVEGHVERGEGPHRRLQST